MGPPQLLSLVLLIQIVPSQLTEGKSLAMQTSLGTAIGDAPQTPLGMTTIWEFLRSSYTSLDMAGLQNSLLKSLPSPARSRPKRSAWERPEDRECRLRSLQVRVKDLGLGYSSEETILFKFCSGSCPKARSNHDLTLSALLQRSEIPAMGDPCCRPTHYEDVAFLDDRHQWQEVEQLSAAACSCVG
ncbi:persephin [Lacerta agilis]|uniref:persephin n=1 Tax=Lacerta agilis TaxID=80427 RepID=UPI0014191880|nr:persephin [Lacerta agilis]